MNRIQIRDFYGKVLGTVETLPNKDKILRDFYGKILGRYDSKMDVTRDFYGKIITRGDQLSMLLKPH